jgi:hypothetical protein
VRGQSTSRPSNFVFTVVYSHQRTPPYHQWRKSWARFLYTQNVWINLPYCWRTPASCVSHEAFWIVFPCSQNIISFFLLPLVNLMNSDGSCRVFFCFFLSREKVAKPRDFRESLSRRLKPAQHPYPSHHISIVLRELSTICRIQSLSQWLHLSAGLFSLCLCSSLVCAVDLLLVV